MKQVKRNFFIFGMVCGVAILDLAIFLTLILTRHEVHIVFHRPVWWS